MKMLTTLIFLISLAGSALAQPVPPPPPGAVPPPPPVPNPIRGAPGPEMSAGILGMTLAVGVLYLIKRRYRT